MGEGDRERWDARYRAAGPVGPAPSWLASLADELPTGGRALDVACGRGALSLWLASRGLSVTAVDVSEVALDALTGAARARGLAIDPSALDLERDALPAGPFALIACIHYRQPSLLPELVARLAPGGALALEQHTVRNLERHAKPSRRFLAEPQELLDWARSAGLAVVSYREGWVQDRAVAQLLARR